MADAATVIAELRRLIDEPEDAAPWTDVYLETRITAWEGSLNSLAAAIWREKAASYAGLVDIQEGNSNRKMSQLYAQALKMAEGLGGAIETPDVAGPRRSRTRPIERA